jgi:hypothetical protein
VAGRRRPRSRSPPERGPSWRLREGLCRLRPPMDTPARVGSAEGSFVPPRDAPGGWMRKTA